MRAVGGSSKLRLLLGGLVLFSSLLAMPQTLLADDATSIIDRILSGEPEDLSFSLRMVILMTVLTVAPAFLLLTTCFTRIVIVLSFVRRALGTQEVPPNQVVVGLALFLTFMVMAPTWQDIYENALVPYMAGADPESSTASISGEEAIDYSLTKMRDFMFRHIDENDLLLMSEIANPDLVEKYGADDGVLTTLFIDEVPTTTVIPAFILSELRRAFEMGFLIYLPFLVIDVVVASILISMGMMMMPPVLVSLPFKILVFVLVDGWGMVVEQLALSFAN